MRTGQELVKVVKGPRSVDEVGDVAGLFGVDARRDVDQDERCDEVGPARRDEDRGEPPKGHANEGQRAVGDLLDGAREIVGVARYRRGGEGRGIGVAVTGRSSATSGRPSASATVSKVCAFCAPPWTRTISGVTRPHAQTAHLAQSVDRDEEALHDGNLNVEAPLVEIFAKK